MLCKLPTELAALIMTSNKSKRIKLTIGVAIFLVMIAACKSSQQNLNKSNEQPPPVAPEQSAPTGFVKEANFITPGNKSTYDHFRDGHKQLTDCGECHKRDTKNPAAPVSLQPGHEYWQPYHDACSRCHKTDREKYNLTEAGTTKANPFCGGCHTDPPVAISADQTFKAKLLEYPKKNEEFGIMGGVKGFSHKTHMDQAKMGNDVNISCGLCHDVKSNPTQATFGKHQQCYQCHTHQAGQKLGDCGICHINATQAVKYSPGMGSAANYKFRHSASHLKAASCERCHKTLEPPAEPRVDIQQISTARGQKHSSACWTCHVQKKEAVCSKCHTGSLPF
jgi:hypothetical protein